MAEYHYDVVIIGAGPAGEGAAIYVSARILPKWVMKSAFPWEGSSSLIHHRPPVLR